MNCYGLGFLVGILNDVSDMEVIIVFYGCVDDSVGLK